MQKINIIFRACDCVPHLNAGRPDLLDKPTLIKVCFLSMYESVKGFPHSIHVLGDRLSGEMQLFFKRFPVSLSNMTLGNDASIAESISLALKLPDDELVYFCEDDYLHEKEAFRRIDEFLEDFAVIAQKGAGSRSSRPGFDKRPLFIHPVDYPDNYKSERLEASLIFLSKECHWRQIRDITFTFLTHARTIKRFRPVFLKSTIRARDWLLSEKLFDKGKCLCVSPIPGLATHMHSATQSPFFNWRRLYDFYKDQLLTDNQ